MNIVWYSTVGGDLQRASLTTPIKREGMWNDGMEDGYLKDVGYIINTNKGWKVKFYGTVCRNKHPIEDTLFDNADSAKEMLEKYGISMLVARYLSPA
jgi:hypothetical protein